VESVDQWGGDYLATSGTSMTRSGDGVVSAVTTAPRRAANRRQFNLDRTIRLEARTFHLESRMVGRNGRDSCQRVLGDVAIANCGGALLDVDS
jgi:hypothetical protein